MTAPLGQRIPAATARSRRTGSLGTKPVHPEPQTFTVSWPGAWEVHGQGSSRVCSPERPLLSSQEDGELQSSGVKDAHPVGLGARSTSSFNLNYFLPPHSHTGVGASTQEFGGHESVRSKGFPVQTSEINSTGGIISSKKYFKFT